MKLEQLNYFLEAAKTGHIGKAAQVLHITPSAVSHSIALLEEELGQELFVKKGKRIFLTSHGKVLMEGAERLLKEVKVLQDQVTSEHLEVQGHYRLGASHDLCSRILAPAWVALQNENKKLVGEVFTLRSSQVVSGVVGGEYDLGLCFSPVKHPDTESEILFNGQLLICVAKDHPVLKKKESERLAEISNYPAVLPKAFQGIDVCERHPIFKKFGIKATPDFLIDCYQVGVAKVASSQSWGFMPDWVIAMNQDRIKALKPPAGWAAPYDISVVWSKDRTLSSAMKKLIAILTEEIKKKLGPE